MKLASALRVTRTYVTKKGVATQTKAVDSKTKRNKGSCKEKTEFFNRKVEKQKNRLSF